MARKPEALRFVQLLTDKEVSILSRPVAIPEADSRSDNAIYYTDILLTVVWANDAFARFAADNGAADMPRSILGGNVLASFSGVHRARWEAIYPELIAGRLLHHQERFSCPSPKVRREFVLHIAPVEIDNVMYLRHETRLLHEGEGSSFMESALRQEGGFPDKGYRFAACQRPVGGECGDGVWARELGHGKAVLMIADAMGHGTAAANALRDFVAILEADPFDDPLLALIRANNQFMARPGHVPGFTPFITGLLMMVDTAGGSLGILCFGHHGVVFTPSGPVEVRGGLPVGLLADYDEWPLVPLDVAALGSRVLAYTDGIVEQFNANGEMYGLDKLARDFSVTSSLPLATSLATVLENLDAWRGTALVKDDQSLLGIEVPRLAARR